MKKTLLLIVITLAIKSSFAQQTAFGISLNSGLFSFSGKSAEKTTAISYAAAEKLGYTNNPYGSKNGLSYGFSLYIQRATKKGFLFGLDAGYETLKSKISITQIFYVPSFFSSSTPTTTTINARGNSYFNNSFLNFYPFAGYRFSFNRIKLDLTGGLDIAHCLSAKEKAKATDSDGKNYNISPAGKTINTDIRTRIQLTAHYKMIGIYAGYSAGFTNYMSGYIGGINEAYSRMLRFGTTFTIK
ncbi:MAG: hypothetical protein IT249_09365 [Chitinophagaceae bacterium]|nr:hypothetical protein [Chitinophagaceae bacterium]